MESSGDIRLIERAQGGDAGAFERLLEDNYMLIYRAAYKFTGAREDAEDVAQEVCLKLAGAIKSYKGGSSFTTWLYRVVVNAARDHIRKHSAKQRHESEYVKEAALHAGNQGISDNPGQEGSGRGVSPEALFTEISRMPEKYRDALLLVHSEGLSHREAGEVLGCAESTVSWRVHEGKRKLTETFKMRNKHE